MATLNILYNAKSIDLIPLGTGETCIIGRDAASDVVIDELIVSFHHAKIESHGKGFLLADLDSENGTFVNGKRTNSVWLNDGDAITVGNHNLIFSNPLIIDIPDKLHKSIVDTISISSDTFKDLQRHQNVDVSGESNYKSIRPMVLVLLPDHGKIVPLIEKPITLGKASTSDIVLKGLGVGANAGIIEKLTDGWHLSYVGGLAKLRVNGKFSKKPVRLKEFDIISLGRTRMQVLVR